MNKEILIHKKNTVKEALKQLDKVATKTLLVVDGSNKLIGSISDGDIRRFILSGKDLTDDIGAAYNKTPVYFDEKDFTLTKAKEVMLNKKIELIPIVNNEGVITNYITWAEAFSDNSGKQTVNDFLSSIPLVIMAGGKGTRLEPFTNVFPKPLFPIGGQTITETIIDEFKKYGIKDYYLTLNYKGSMVESYFNSIEKDYNVKYIKENKFLGTAGSLRLLKGKIKGTFLVSNCDIIVKAKYDDVVALHEKNNASITILSSIKHYKIPYGIVSFENGGIVTEVSEKPEYTFTINTGVYVVNSDVIDLIPEDTSFNMTDLIEVLIKNNKKVATYPVNENDYVDIGLWDEYKKTVNKFNCEEL